MLESIGTKQRRAFVLASMKHALTKIQAFEHEYTMDSEDMLVALSVGKVEVTDELLYWMKWYGEYLRTREEVATYGQRRRKHH